MKLQICQSKDQADVRQPNHSKNEAYNLRYCENHVPNRDLFDYDRTVYLSFSTLYYFHDIKRFVQYSIFSLSCAFQTLNLFGPSFSCFLSNFEKQHNSASS